jgi:ribosomal protein S18 acetylase RimI-like enzyme
MEILPAADMPADRLRLYVIDTWHADFVVAHGERIRPAELPGFVAIDGDRIAGHAAYRIGPDGCELVPIAAQPRRVGIGSRLLERVVEVARDAGSGRIWLTTTNDNLDALRFYQRRGFQLQSLRTGAVAEARRTMKPDLPETGAYDIPMRDELDLELPLAP